MKPETSLAKIEANRENAKKSTGPKDTSLTRFNAQRKNIHHDEILLKDEDSEEFRKLNKRFREGLAPQGVLENYLVDRLVAAIWRLKRVIRIDSCNFECIFDKIENFVEEFEELGYDSYEDALDAWCGLVRATFRRDFNKPWLILLSYEKVVETQIYKALKELNRLQSARRRGKLQPAISVDVGDVAQP